ncbi:MAG: sulfite exporter TauE/SafE family protein [Pseudomonadota bacterium]
MLNFLPPDVTIDLLLPIACVGLVAGLVKGIVGFAMPMMWITGLTFFVSPDLALALLILPTAVTNIWQSLREGMGAAAQSLWDHKRFIMTAFVVLLCTTQIVPYLSIDLFFLILGILIVLFAVILLLGWQPSARQTGPLHTILALISGFAGGIAGILGPPTVAYLNTLNIKKLEFMRVQGIIYGLGAVLLVVGHGASGILTPGRLALSLFTLPTALLGIWIGFQIQHHINQRTFKMATLIVLLLSGANLVRRGIMG